MEDQPSVSSYLTGLPAPARFDLIENTTTKNILIKVGNFTLNQIFVRSELIRFITSDKLLGLLVFAQSIINIGETDSENFVWQYPFISFNVTKHYVNIRNLSNCYSFNCDDIGRCSLASTLTEIHQSIIKKSRNENGTDTSTKSNNDVPYYRDPHVG